MCRYGSITYMCDTNGIIHHIIELVKYDFRICTTLEVHKKWHIFVIMEDCYFPQEFRKRWVRIFFYLWSNFPS